MSTCCRHCSPDCPSNGWHDHRDDMGVVSMWRDEWCLACADTEQAAADLEEEAAFATSECCAAWIRSSAKVARSGGFAKPEATP